MSNFKKYLLLTSFLCVSFFVTALHAPVFSSPQTLQRDQKRPFPNNPFIRPIPQRGGTCTTAALTFYINHILKTNYTFDTVLEIMLQHQNITKFRTKKYPGADSVDQYLVLSKILNENSKDMPHYLVNTHNTHINKKTRQEWVSNVLDTFDKSRVSTMLISVRERGSKNGHALVLKKVENAGQIMPGLYWIVDSNNTETYQVVSKNNLIQGNIPIPGTGLKNAYMKTATAAFELPYPKHAEIIKPGRAAERAQKEYTPPLPTSPAPLISKRIFNKLGDIPSGAFFIPGDTPHTYQTYQKGPFALRLVNVPGKKGMQTQIQIINMTDGSAMFPKRSLGEAEFLWSNLKEIQNKSSLPPSPPKNVKEWLLFKLAQVKKLYFPPQKLKWEGLPKVPLWQFFVPGTKAGTYRAYRSQTDGVLALQRVLVAGKDWKIQVVNMQTGTSSFLPSFGTEKKQIWGNLINNLFKATQSN